MEKRDNKIPADREAIQDEDTEQKKPVDKEKSPIDADVQEGNLNYDSSDPSGLKTTVEKHDRQE